VPTFDELVDEAAAAPVDGWDFSWLEGRATEERPSWHYFELVAEHVAGASRLLDVETGTGNLLADLPALPPLAVGTDAHVPSIERARPRLQARGAHLVQTAPGDERLPVRSSAFDLVVSRHPIATDWSEIARVLAPGGRVVSQQIGPDSLRQLSEAVLGPLPPSSSRQPDAARRAAEDAGLVVDRLEAERPRTVFHDIGAVVYFLRLVVWIAPGFSVDRHRDQLRRLHEHITEHGSFEATASRFLVCAHTP
jgi:SAM-dependent methyltransferase